MNIMNVYNNLNDDRVDNQSPLKKIGNGHTFFTAQLMLVVDLALILRIGRCAKAKSTNKSYAVYVL